MPGTKHIWIDGPDGLECHCPICGISKVDDWQCHYDTCEGFMGFQARKISLRGDVSPTSPVFSDESQRWSSFIAKQEFERYDAKFDDEEFAEDAVKAGYSFIARLRKSLGE